ncbi:60S ribosomal protein L10a-2 [Hordeum vulgare]|nr:60S ribosomal protein L10a-2 [Hordeum vulgare]
MDGDYVSGLLAGTAGLDFRVPGLDAGFFETLCGAGGAGAAGLAAMFGDRAAGMHGFGNGGQFGPAEGGGGELAAASREGSSVSDPAWAYDANAKKRKAPAAGAAKGKVAAATFAKVLPEGDAGIWFADGGGDGPDSKKCKIEDEMVRREKITLKMKMLQDLVPGCNKVIGKALEKPRERLSVLRMEQDILKFLREPGQTQFEFQGLRTSYLRLAAHRLAQHYFLISIALSDNSLLDGTSSRIILRKTSAECRLPAVRLADIPVNLPQEETSVVATKVAIKQRPQKNHHGGAGAGANSSRGNLQKSVEERKEEYNRARARIFNNSSGSSSPVDGRPADEVVLPNTLHRSTSLELNPNTRYMQRFDPGFGFNGGAYTIQPLYAPVVTYNTEFPQLGSPQMSHVPVEQQQPHPMAQHMPGPWSPAQSPNAFGYRPSDGVMPPYSPGQAGAPVRSSVFMHASQQYAMPSCLGVTFVHPQDSMQPFAQEGEIEYVEGDDIEMGDMDDMQDFEGFGDEDDDGDEYDMEEPVRKKPKRSDSDSSSKIGRKSRKVITESFDWTWAEAAIDEGPGVDRSSDEGEGEAIEGAALSPEFRILRRESESVMATRNRDEAERRRLLSSRCYRPPLVNLKFAGE